MINISAIALAPTRPEQSARQNTRETSPDSGVAWLLFMGELYTGSSHMHLFRKLVNEYGGDVRTIYRFFSYSPKGRFFPSTGVLTVYGGDGEPDMPEELLSVIQTKFPDIRKIETVNVTADLSSLAPANR